MTITRVQTFILETPERADAWARPRPLIFVRLEAKDGIVGWGEAYPLHGRVRAIQELISSLGETLIGVDDSGPRPFRNAAILNFADKRAGIDLYAAISALEMALWDVAGKRLEAPIHQLLGSALRTQIPLYANIYSTIDRSTEGYINRAVAMVERGFTRLKFYPMDGRTLLEGEDCVARVRDAVGSGIELMIDLNGLDDSHLALQAGLRFAPYDPFWFEEPVSSDDVSCLSDIRARLPLRIVSGERHGGKFRFRELLEARAVDALNPDISTCGGIQELLEIAAMAEACSVTVTPHNFNSTSIAMAAMMQAASLIPNLLPAEYCPDDAAFGEIICRTDITIANGTATVPKMAGLGAALCEAEFAPFILATDDRS